MVFEVCFGVVITCVVCFGVSLLMLGVLMFITMYFGVVIYLIPLIDRRGHLFNSSERFSLDLCNNFMKTCVLSFGVVFEVHFGVVSHLIMCVFVWF